MALISEPTIAKAAEIAQVPIRTVHMWMREEAFGNEYRRRRREAFSQAIGMAQRYTPLALQTLGKTLVDETAPHSARVAAATGILRFARESIELDDLAERIRAVEASLGGRGAKTVKNEAEPKAEADAPRVPDDSDAPPPPEAAP